MENNKGTKIKELPKHFIKILEIVYTSDKNTLQGKKMPLEAIEELYKLYQEYNPEPLIVETDPNGNITFINDKFAKIAKYIPEELIGKNTRIFKSENTPPGIFQIMWNKISQGQIWRDKLENNAKDKTKFWIDMCIVPIMESSGEIIRYLGIAYDITKEKKHELALARKTEEMLESMRYAKRIQKLFLPDKKLLRKFLPDFFVTYKPKDVVSGDFYWAALTPKIGFVAVVDCTGHGVPGALMSIIGHNTLNDIVIRDQIYDPGQILTELHKRIRKTLRQDTRDKSRDGMDLTLIAIQLGTNVVHFAGANNSAYWWVEKEQKVERVKGDKKSIGGEQLEEERIFTTKELIMEHNDCLYLFTDGIPDQFGGPDD